MKYFYPTLLLIFFLQTSFSQDISEKKNTSRKGEFYMYWGWNYGCFTSSDLHFTGADYDFTLNNVIANDRQSTFSLKTYFHPTYFTIPQYNFRIGYYISNKYNISLASDHMKYVMQNGQTAKISGSIQKSGTPFDGLYDNDDIVLDSDFLQFEHTDGLNYINIGINRLDHLFDWRFLTIDMTEGFGAGILVPRTNTTLFNQERYDQFHLSGFGVNAMLGLQIHFRRYFFIQTELKGGYINMPDIRTTISSRDRASQQFFFGQWNIVFGATLNPKKKK